MPNLLGVVMGHPLANYRPIEHRIVQVQMAERADFVLLRNELLTIWA